MKQKSPILRAALAAILMGILGFIVFNRYFGSKPQEFAQQETQAPVVRALFVARPLKRGDIVNASDFTWEEVNDAEIVQIETSNGYTDTANALFDEELSGRMAVKNIARGDLVTEGMFLDRGNRLSMNIRPNMRAVAVEISPETAVSGLIIPNDYIDLSITESDVSETGNARGGNYSQSGKLIASYPVLENIRVLSIDQVTKQIADQEAIVGTTATLEIPKSALIDFSSALKLVRDSNYRFTLALRSGLDSGKESGQPTLMHNDFLAVARQPKTNVKLHLGGRIVTQSVNKAQKNIQNNNQKTQRSELLNTLSKQQQILRIGPSQHSADMNNEGLVNKNFATQMPAENSDHYPSVNQVDAKDYQGNNFDSGDPNLIMSEDQQVNNVNPSSNSSAEMRRIEITQPDLNQTTQEVDSDVGFEVEIIE